MISFKARVKVGLFLGLLLSFPALAILPQKATALGPGLNLTPNDGANSDIPQIAVSGNNVHVVWRDASASIDDIFYASSEDNGSTFSDPVNLSNNDGASSSPQISVSGSDVYVAWSDDSFGNSEILFTTSANGTSFTTPTNLSGNSGSSVNPQLAVSGSDVYVAWSDDSPGNSDILLASSTDDYNAINISNNSGISLNPQLAVSGNNVYVAWSDDTPGSFDILLASSTDDYNAINISNNSGSSVSPQIAASGSDVYVAWHDDTPGSFDILLASSANSYNATNISNTGSSSPSSPPQIAVSGSDVSVAWPDSSPGNEDIFFTSSSDGVNFDAPTNISNNDGPSFSPQILSSTLDNIHVAWTDFDIDEIDTDDTETSNFEVLMSTKPSGDSFGCPINLSANFGNSLDPVMALADDGSSAYVAWYDTDLATFVSEVLLQADIDPLAPTIVINPLATTSPLWGVGEITASGSVANADTGDRVIVEWGDGNSEEVEILGCTWQSESHTYDSTAVSSNPNNVVATLVAADDTEKDVSGEISINVLKHQPSLTLDPISTVKQGNNVTVTGSILDSVTGDPISGGNITFLGSGATGLASVLADPDGLFSSTGSTLNSTEDDLVVEAHFDGVLAFEQASESGLYDIVDLNATEFVVTSGAGVQLELTGYNASIVFDEILEDGTLFVSKCDTQDPTKFVALDLCIRISPAVQMGPESTALVTISFEDTVIPDGYTGNNIDLFRSSGGAIVDVTSDRDLANETVTGRVSDFSNFIAGIAVHPVKPEGAHRTQVFVGDGNSVTLRDINNQENTTAVIGLDEESYDISDDPVVTVDDPNGNADATEIDVANVGVMSDTSDPLAIWVQLTETSVDSGSFEGTFGFDTDSSNPAGGPLKAESNDGLTIFYTSGARFAAEIDGVTESGLVELSDFLVGDECFEPVGSAVRLKLIDAELESGARINVNMSYANAIIGDLDLSTLQLIHRGDDLNWVDITVADSLNPAAKTLSGEIQSSTFSEGLFVLGTDLDVDCGGGAGGGFGRGLVVDAVASIARESSSSGGGGGGGGGGSVAVSARPSGTATIGNGNDVSISADIQPRSGYLGGEVTLNFDNVVNPGSIRVEEHQLASITNLFTSVDSGHGTLESADGSSFTTAGAVFDISARDALQFQGMVDVTIPYNEALAASILSGSSSEDNIRFMYFDGNAWHDMTISKDSELNTVTGRISGFSEVVAAVVDDGTFGKEYFTENPMERLIPVIDQPDVSATGITFADSQGNSVITASRGQDITVVTTIKNPQRVTQDYDYIMEVFDSSGVVVEIDIISGSIDSTQAETIQQASLEVGGEAGAYTIKVFLITNDENPELLADVMVAQLPVVNSS
ncbi:MAG TPA: hypothetical protein VGQ03_10625 [Nitrososphaera sp.]|nr:hypothetical protein [Nitrososphaera sp.]